MQSLITYVIVALAAAWVIWSILLPRRARAALRRLMGRSETSAGSCCSGDDGGKCRSPAPAKRHKDA
jgi:uncharacterized membrane protein YccC